MNATILYTQLSREIFDLSSDCNDEKLNNLMKSDRGFYKLRSLLLCRACRDLCINPYSSTFCQHLVCKECLEQKKSRNPGCKWCRNEEDLVEDVQSKILIGLYKQLCAILKNIASETDGDGNFQLSGTTISVREKLLTFLSEGCSLPDFVAPKIPIIEEVNTNSQKSTKRGRFKKQIDTVKTNCPPCCCKCGKKSEIIETKQNEKADVKSPQSPDISNDPIKVTAAQSSEERICEAKTAPELYASDRVTSTVPDSVPAESSKRSTIKNQNKDGGYNKNKRAAQPKEKGTNKVKNVKRGRGRPRLKLIPTVKEIKDLGNRDNKLKPSKKYETDLPNSGKKSSIVKKEDEPIETFKKQERFPKLPTSKPPSLNSSLTRKKLHLNETSKLKEIPPFLSQNKEIIESPPRIMPLKLTVQKIDNSSNNVSYKIQYNSAHESLLSDPPASTSQEPVVETNNITEGFRKAKRKATFVTNYAVFSDDSDFELDIKKSKKIIPQVKKTQESCGCGAGSNVKFFTDICKRQRCPCYSQGRACVNCKCRFCSNPYLLEDEIICTDDSDDSSDSANSETMQWSKSEAEHVDVESM